MTWFLGVIFFQSFGRNLFRTEKTRPNRQYGPQYASYMYVLCVFIIIDVKYAGKAIRDTCGAAIHCLQRRVMVRGTPPPPGCT